MTTRTAPTTPPPAPAARPTRTVRVMRTALFAAAAGLAAVGLAIAAAHALPRVDMTARGDHALSERTAALIGELAEPATIVLAVDPTRLDRRAADRVADVLDAFENTGSVRTRRIDSGSAQGLDQLRDLVEELVERERPIIEAGLAEAAAISAELRTIATQLGDLNESMLAAVGSDAGSTARTYLTQRAAFARVAADELTDTADAIAAALTAPGIPDPAAAVASVPASLETLDEQLAAMRGAVRTHSVAATGAQPRLTAGIDAIRESAAAARERSLTIDRPEAARIAEVLGSGEAALVIAGAAPGQGRPTIAAIELETLFPPPAADAARGLSVAGEAGARAETLFGDALAALVDPTPPVAVFVHGEPTRFVGTSGLLRELLARLRARGIDAAEWAVAVDAARPDLSRMNPGGLRPVVWVVISPDSAAAGRERRDGGATANGTERARAVAAAVRTLVDERASVMVNLNPSVFPTFGAADPIVETLAGIVGEADSGRPVLRPAVVDGRPTIETGHTVRTTGDHPIAAAVRGLAIRFPWPVPLAGAVPTDGADALATPVAVLDDDSAWAESEWVRVWRTPTASRPLLPDPPSFGAGDARGPFTVALAGERGGERSGARTVVIGSNTWMLDGRWAERRAVDGRVTVAAPGNPALFEACVLWLAGREAFMGRGVEASAVPRVRDLGGGTLVALRWLLVAGVPAGVLVVGGVTLSRRQ